MDLRIMFVMAVLSAAFVALAVPADKSSAQTAKNIVGTWALVSDIADRGDRKVEAFASNPKGLLVLDANGHYVLAVARPGSPKFAANNRMTGTAEENAVTTHFGTYAVDESGKTINFRIETSTFADWDGTEQKRPFSLSGDQLKYTIAAASGGGTAEVVWKRLK
jgi:Lipocalin-like domain